MIRSSVLGFVALVLSSCGTSGAEEFPLKTLAEQRGIRFGSLYQYDIRSGVYDQVFETEMNVMTL